MREGTHASVQITVRIVDMDRTRLFIWELRELLSAMLLVQDPRAEELERILFRYTDGGDDEHEVDTT